MFGPLDPTGGLVIDNLLILVRCVKSIVGRRGCKPAQGMAWYQQTSIEYVLDP